MKRSLLILVALFFTTILFSQQKTVSIRIEQDNYSYPVIGQEINLQKAPFKIVVSLYHLDGVYLFADFSDSIFRLNESEKIPGFRQLPEMAMAETSFNEDQELLIDKEGWAYWFYNKKEDWHRFDKNILVTKDSVVGTKTIKQFYFSEGKRTITPGQIDSPLYLFFVAIDKEDKKGVPVKELTRLKIKINWQ